MRSHLNRGNNFVVSSAATDVALERLLDLGLRRQGILPKQRHTGQDHSRRAITALHGIALNERFLHRVEAVPVGEALNRGDPLPCHAARRSDARAVRDALDENRAGSALPLATAVFGAGKVHLIPQNEKQGPLRINRHVQALAIHNQIHTVILDPTGQFQVSSLVQWRSRPYCSYNGSMNSFLLRACNLAGILAALCMLGACVVWAQDWKNADALPAVDFNGLTPAQKATALKILREHDCSCGCGMKMAQCRVQDPSCSYSKGLASEVVQAIKNGKSEADAITAASASKWAHLQQRRLLEDPVAIPVGGAPSIGPQKASVTLVEFSDFQCPYCAAAAPELAAVLKAYPTQVKLIFKEYPLEMHSQAALAAAAAVAAHKQGKFWPMYDAMFAARDDLSRENLLALAQKNGLDLKRFQADLDSTEVKEAITRDVQDGDQAGVSGTPTLFIDGQRYNGPIELESLKPVLDAELKHPALGPQAVSTKP